LIHFDTIVVVCYPTLLPAQRFTLLGIRALNVHPAPLPDLRGPDPLFYTARGDVPATITIHQLDATYDTGDVLAATRVHLPPSCDELQYIRIHAVQAAQLYSDVVASELVAVPQRAGAPVGWAAFPFAEAYTLDPQWPMVRTQRFIALTDARKHPYWVPGVQQWVRALGVEGPVQVQCADGVLRARA
jgi:methionyl-tRNA formyltransferase